MSEELSSKACIPCQLGAHPLKGEALAHIAAKLETGWTVVDEHHIEKTYKFKNFKEALDFTNRVGDIAETEGHHPDIYLAWGKVQLKIWTHKIDGLTESDFFFAAKADKTYAVS